MSVSKRFATQGEISVRTGACREREGVIPGSGSEWVEFEVVVPTDRESDLVAEAIEAEVERLTIQRNDASPVRMGVGLVLFLNAQLSEYERQTEVAQGFRQNDDFR